MEKNNEFINQVRKVIEILEQYLINDKERPILITLYSRYMNALEVLENGEDIKKIMIKGGCRAYLDAFSDYMNPLLLEMDKAEKIFSQMIDCK